ncbi:MAG TPA: DUF397 domain-containing protein [Trebonia sp.]|jgi:hypothetical protein|nr:DUF397 domain-containing protein [Trebonia sp.]
MDKSCGWRKASYSNGSGDCVEVGHLLGLVAIRDTRQRGHGPVLAFTPEQWHRFTAELRSE